MGLIVQIYHFEVVCKDPHVNLVFFADTLGMVVSTLHVVEKIKMNQCVKYLV